MNVKKGRRRRCLFQWCYYVTDYLYFRASTLSYKKRCFFFVIYCFLLWNLWHQKLHVISNKIRNMKKEREGEIMQKKIETEIYIFMQKMWVIVCNENNRNVPFEIDDRLEILSVPYNFMSIAFRTARWSLGSLRACKVYKLFEKY